MRLKEADSEVSYIDFPIEKLMEAVLYRGASFRLKVRGFSMTPFIQDGDIVTVSPLNRCQNLFGKIVAFIHPRSKRLVIHRVIGKLNKGWFVKGDSARFCDGLIRREDILGYISKIERNDKTIHFGLGPERFLIALLSRRVFPLLFFISKNIPLSIRKILKWLISF